MVNDKIKEAIRDYLSSNEEGFLFIDGEWGVGKTFFVKKLKDELNNLYKGVYISLNGLKNIEEIKKEIACECHPLITKFQESNVRRVLTWLVNLPLQAVAGSEIGKIEYEAKIDAHYLILDDVERCLIDYPTLFGFINYLQTSFIDKIILIGNEEYLTKKNKGKETNFDFFSGEISNKKDDEDYCNEIKKYEEQEKLKKYLICKEKSFEKKVSFHFDIDILFDEIIEDKEFNTIKEIVLQYKDEILKILDLGECKNFRICKRALYVAKYFCDKLESVKEKAKHIDLINFDIISRSFYEVIKRDIGFVIKNETFFYSPVTHFPSIETYVLHSDFDIKNFINELKDAEEDYFNDEYSQPIKNLNDNWSYFDDEFIKKNIRKALKNLYENKLPYTNFIPLCKYLLYYEQFFGRDKSIDRAAIHKVMLESLKEYNGKTEHISNFEISNTYPNEIEKEIKEIQYLINEKALDTKVSEKLIILKKDDLTNADIKALSINSSGSSLLADLGPDLLLQVLEKSGGRKISSIRYVLRETYNVSNANDFYKKDIETLKTFKDGLLKLVSNSKSITKKVALNYFIDDIERYIKNIDR